MTETKTFRIVFWNIQHGGGSRAGSVVEQILEWQADVVALAEFRGTAPSRAIAKSLRAAGLKHQLSAVDSENPTWNAVFLASRYKLVRVKLDGVPTLDLYWMLAKVNSKPIIHVGVVHIPLDEYLPGYWLEYRKSLLNMARDWKLGPALFLGDMNSAISSLDEETEYSQGYKESFMGPMEDRGWRDPFRALHPEADAPTWISRIGRGFRLDQAFVNPELHAVVSSCSYDWGKDADPGDLSDHAAILLDLEIPA